MRAPFPHSRRECTVISTSFFLSLGVIRIVSAKRLMHRIASVRFGFRVHKLMWQPRRGEEWKKMRREWAREKMIRAQKTWNKCVVIIIIKCEATAHVFTLSNCMAVQVHSANGEMMWKRHPHNAFIIQNSVCKMQASTYIQIKWMNKENISLTLRLPLLMQKSTHKYYSLLLPCLTWHAAHCWAFEFPDTPNTQTQINVYAFIMRASSNGEQKLCGEIA